MFKDSGLGDSYFWERRISKMVFQAYRIEMMGRVEMERGKLVCRKER